MLEQCCGSCGGSSWRWNEPPANGWSSLHLEIDVWVDGGGLRLQQPESSRSRDHLHSAFGVQLAEDVVDVRFHCCQRHHQFARDVLIRVAFGDQTQHLELALG